jgi:hypothetical protein
MPSPTIGTASMSAFFPTTLQSVMRLS